MEKELDLRIQKTYRALHLAFTELLLEKRFEEFGVNDLCDRAMIRRTTFYKHFGDKYEYFSFYIHEVCAEFQQNLRKEGAPEDIDAYIAGMSREFIGFIQTNHILVNHIRESSAFSLLLSILFEYMTQHVSGALIRYYNQNEIAKPLLKQIAAFYSGGIINMISQQFHNPGEFPAEFSFPSISKLIQAFS